MGNTAFCKDIRHIDFVHSIVVVPGQEEEGEEPEPPEPFEWTDE